MPIILKGKMEVKTVEQKQTAQPMRYKWDSNLRKIVPVEEPLPKEEEPVKHEVKQKPIQIIHKQVVQKETVEPPSHYVNQVHGDLEKKINTKSDYLRDMLDFENNK